MFLSSLIQNKMLGISIKEHRRKNILQILAKQYAIFDN